MFVSLCVFRGVLKFILQQTQRPFDCGSAASYYDFIDLSNDNVMLPSLRP